MTDAERDRIARDGMYRPEFESDACGVGLVAAGDIVRGASLVVWAIRDGRDVADHMHNYLTAKAASERQAA